MKLPPIPGAGRLVAVLFISALMGCGSKPASNPADEVTAGEPCSVTVSGVQFTKSLLGAKSVATVEGDKLVMTSGAKTDHFNEPDGKASYSTAPILLTAVDNTKPFTFTTKLTPTFTETYDAGAVYIYMNSTSWFKFAFERDERAKTRIVTVRTRGTSDDNNHDVVDSTSVYMKISSDGTSLGFYYSVDNDTWQLVRLFRNEFPAQLWAGLSAQSPMAQGNTVTFEAISLRPEAVKDFRLGK